MARRPGRELQSNRPKLRSRKLKDSTEGRRVLHAVRRFGEMSQTFVVDLIEGTDSLGWEAWVGSQWVPVNRDKFVFPPDARLLRPIRPPLWKAAAARLARQAPRERAATWWEGVVDTVEPAVVHVHFGWLGATVAFERLGMPLVVSFHGSDVRRWPHESPEKSRMYHELLRGLRCAVASSRSIAEDLRRLGYAGRLEVIPPGVRFDRFEFRLPPDNVTAPRLLFVGRQVAAKGLDVLLQAMPEVLRAYPATTLTVIGSGDDEQRNLELAQSLGVTTHVEFLGAQPRDVVARELIQAHVLVVPSRTTASGEAEGHPVAPKEAFATGVPVVATRCGGLPEVVPPSQRPDLVPEADAASLARAIVDLLGRPETWPQRAAVARAWVEKEFNSRALAEKLADLYGELRVPR